MLKIFRKIRQGLLIEKNSGKYLKYALGEIVLVVIGILIALQVNNWNEIGKSKSEGNRLLLDLRQDLQNDIVNFNALQTEYNGWLQEIDHVLNQVLDGKSKAITEYHQLGAGRLSMNHLSIDKITYLDMFNSGRKLEFDHPNIVREIKSYYQYADNELIKLNIDNEEFYRLLMSYYGVNGINTLNRVIEKRNLEHIDWTWLTDPSSQEYINLETAMLLYKLVIGENLAVIQKLKEKSILLIETIEEG